jgi:hypothetical protein
MDMGLDSLAVYPDGNARYINQSGYTILYDRDGRLDTLIAAVGAPAKAIYMTAPASKKEDRKPLAKNEFRITFLTPRGPRTVVEDRRNFGRGSPYSDLFLALGGVLQGITSLKK